MVQSGRNVEMAAGMSSNMSPTTVSGASVVRENMYEGTSSASKMGPDRGGFNSTRWTPPTMAPNKPTFTGRLGNFGFRGGGGGMSPYGLRGNR